MAREFFHPWGDGISDGDSGVYTPPIYHEIESDNSDNRKFRMRTLPDIQAEVLRFAQDESQGGEARVAAYRLVFDMALLMANQPTNPIEAWISENSNG